MKTIILLVTLFAVASAKWVDIDWARPLAEMQKNRYMQPLQRITNGKEATPGQFPYQIRLISEYPNGNTEGCGGSVLTNNYILTAAHCVIDGPSTLATGGTAIMGLHDETNVQEPSQQRIRFSQSGIRTHPQYSFDGLRNDIAVVRLDSLITYNIRVQPTRLPARSDTRDFAGLTGVISGFGATSDDPASGSPVLRFTSNPIMTNSDCAPAYGPGWVQDQNVCINADGGRAACPGDSGGPLTIQECGSLQVGVFSFLNINGCTLGFPSVYARVSYYLDWIEANSDYVARP